LIHTFEGHIKEVSAIEEYPGIKGVAGTAGDATYILSSSLDGSVKVWSLDKFQLIYNFSLPYTLTFSKLFNHSKYLVVGMKDKMLICGVHIIGELYLSPEVPIASLRAGYTSAADRDSSNFSFSMALCENNSIYI
jgi:WD40 repeat protein